MFRSRKSKVFETIQKERALLSAKETRILNEIRKRLLNDPKNVNLVSDAEYSLLTEGERHKNNSAKRIDYILTKEMEYILLNRKLTEKMASWLKDNKIDLITKPIWGGLGATLLFYIEHKNEIDKLVEQLLSGVLKSKITCSRSIEADGIDKITPPDFFADENRSSDATQYLIELSGKGFEIVTADKLEAIIASEL